MKLSHDNCRSTTPVAPPGAGGRRVPPRTRSPQAASAAQDRAPNRRWNPGERCRCGRPTTWSQEAPGARPRPASAASARWKRALRARRDDEAEARGRLVVAYEHVVNIACREGLVLRGPRENLVDPDAPVVERGKPARPEVRRLHHLVEQRGRLLLGHDQLIGRRAILGEGRVHLL